MRTVEEIKKEMTDALMGHPAIIEAFGIKESESYESRFSKGGIINTLLYVYASVLFALESAFSIFKSEIDGKIAELKPHSLRWYRNKTLDFLFGESLVFETDYYDYSQLDMTTIDLKKVVKYCAVTEAKDASIVYIKVAGEKAGIREPIATEQEAALVEYIQQIKDAGVRVSVINRAADSLYIELDVYYNPLVLRRDGSRLDGTDNTPIQDTLKKYLDNLPFNGEYRNADLVDVLQKVPGVIIPELITAQSKYGYNAYQTIAASVIADAGYFILDSKSKLNFKAYESNL